MYFVKDNKTVQGVKSMENETKEHELREDELREDELREHELREDELREHELREAFILFTIAIICIQFLIFILDKAYEPEHSLYFGCMNEAVCLDCLCILMLISMFKGWCELVYKKVKVHMSSK